MHDGARPLPVPNTIVKYIMPYRVVETPVAVVAERGTGGEKERGMCQQMQGGLELLRRRREAWGEVKRKDTA